MINMKCVYTISKINILILLIGSISLIRAVWKALWGVVGRIFDIAVDIIIGPAVISTINLKYDEISDKETKEAGFNSYETWKDKIQNDILAVFAYAVGFNIFFIIIPIITQMELFETTDAFANLPLLNKLSVGFLNQIARLLFIVGAAYMTMRAPKLFASVTKTGNGFDSGASVLGSVKNTISEVSDVVSGQALVDSFTSVKDKLASAIPGSAIAKKISSEIEQRKLYKQALKSGNSKEQAKAMKADLIKQRAEREKVKKERDKKRQERIEQRKKWNNG